MLSHISPTNNSSGHYGFNSYVHLMPFGLGCILFFILAENGLPICHFCSKLNKCFWLVLAVCCVVDIVLMTSGPSLAGVMMMC